MKVKDIMQLKVTVLGSATGYVILNGNDSPVYVQKTATLKEVIDLGYKWKDAIDNVRALPYHSEEQIRLKGCYPCWIPAGVFADGNVCNNGITEYSNLLAIDIDFIDNPDEETMERIKKEIFDMKQVVLVMKSISGKGIFPIFLVKDGRYTTDYCKYIERLFKQKWNIDIDKKCYNIARKRFISYDNEMLIKPDDADIIPWSLIILDNTQHNKAAQPSLFDYKPKIYSDVDEDRDFEKKVDILIELGYDTGKHWADWASFGRIFKPFNNGKELFRKISQNMSAYNASKFDKDWDRIDGKHILTKSHSIAYITTILNREYSNWKNLYYNWK